MTDLSKAERNAIVEKTIATVERKHFDPHFEKDRWRTMVENQRANILDSIGTPKFESALNDLVRSVGTPDSGFFHYVLLAAPALVQLAETGVAIAVRVGLPEPT
jgi:hypothetical protein